MSAPTIRDARQPRMVLTRLENPSDEQIVATLVEGLQSHQVGRRTSEIARKLGMPVRAPYIRRRLTRLEAAGKVARHPSYSAVNDIYWVAAGAQVSR